MTGIATGSRSSRVAVGVVSAMLIAVAWGSVAEARIATNRLATNQLTVNRLATNRLASNRLASNRIALNRIAVNGQALGRAGFEEGAVNPFAGLDRSPIAR